MAIAAVRQIRKSRTELHPAEKHEVHNISIASIKVGKRMRPLGDIAALVESIKEVGLLNPILITQGRRLISGLHRLAAFKALGRTRIPCILLNVSQQEAQLREIDENLARNDLTLLERAEHLHRRKQLYEELHPERRHGGNRGNQHTGGKSCQDTNLKFCQTAAVLTGKSATTVHRLVRIAKLLTPETKELLCGTGWANNQQALMKLCKMPPDMQERVARKAANGESTDICDALDRIYRENLKIRPRSRPIKGDTVQCGDALECMRQLPGKSIKVVITSPPYNLRNSTGGGMHNGSGGKWSHAKLLQGYENGENGDIGDDEMDHKAYVSWQRDCLREMMRVLRDDGAIYYNHKWRVQNGAWQDRADIVNGLPLPVRQIIIWKRKGGINFNKSYYLPTYEVIYFFAGKSFQLAPKANALGDVWEVPQERNNRHPAPFPVELAEMCIKSVGPGIVLDPFMGSGTTAIAAEMCNRRWIGIEVSPGYCMAANERIRVARKLKGSRPLPEQIVEGTTSIM
jgi:modification methylase